MNISQDVKCTRVINATVAGTTTINGSSVDMAGYDSVTFVLALGAITATSVTSLKAQQSSDDGSTDTWADLEGTAITFADDDDNQIAILEIRKPQERYIRPVVVRATANAVIDSCVAMQNNATSEPVTQDATTVTGAELHLAPAEGTA